MSPTPPQLAVKLLRHAVRHDPAGPAILGDLHEDFVEIARTRGVARARLWYWREATQLTLRRRGSARSNRSQMVGKVRRSLAGLLQDCVYAVRNLRSNPGFALFTAVLMGLGIGAVTAVFSVMEPLVIAPLPFPEPHELVWIANETESGDNSLSAVTSRSANLVDFRARSRSFAGITGYNGFFNHAPYTLTGVDEPERLVGVDVVHDFLDVLGVKPLHGRGFREEEGLTGGPRAAILTHRLWQRRFAANPAIVGDSVSLNDKPYTVVGVLPPDFDFSSVFSPAAPVDILLPFQLVAAGDDGFQGNTLHMIGRLRPGVSVEAAQAELDAILLALGRQDPGRWGLAAVATPLQDHVSGPFRPALLLLAVAAATFLLLVCVNLSNLLLARSAGRTREIVVKKALGASRARLARQLVVETLLISLSGAAIGCALAWQITRFVSAQAGIRIPMLDTLRVDGAALLVAVAAAVLSGLLAGLFPAFKMADGREAAVLRDGGNSVSGGRAARRLRESLVIAEVTLACVLLVITGLLVRSFGAVMAVDLGFEAANTVAWKLNATRTFDTYPEQSDFFAEITQRVGDIPGVDNVGLIDEMPLGINRSWPVSILGAPEGDDRDLAFPHIIDPGYLPAMRIALAEGRNFSRDDRQDTQPVVLLNQTAARQMFGTESALGRHLKFWGPWEWQVVGIVQDVRHVSPETDAGMQAYFPVAQMSDYHTLDLVVRSQLPMADVTAAVRGALRDLDPTMPTRETWSVQSRVDRAMSVRRFTLSLLAAFGTAALLVAGLGIYGVVANSVAERIPEIGIRRALGAPTPGVVWDVMSRTLVLAGIGTAAGIMLSLLSARLLASLVYGVGARDPGTFVVGALVLLVVAAVAAVVPATRAARTPGIVALGKN